MDNKVLKLFMVFTTVLSSVQTSWAQGEVNLLSDIRQPQQTSEYIYRSSPKESMIAVQMLGAIQKPGLYYVPANTDLLKILTLAGGSSNGGDLSEVMIRKTEPQKWANVQSKAMEEHRGTYEIDVNSLIKQGGGETLRMGHDDVVYVPPKESWISSGASRTISTVSVILTTVLTVILIDNNSKK